MFSPQTYRHLGVILGKLQVALAKGPLARVWSISADLVSFFYSIDDQNLGSWPSISDKLANAHFTVLSAGALLAELILTALFIESVDSRSCAHVRQWSIAVNHAVAAVVPVLVRVEFGLDRVECHQFHQLRVP